MVRRCPLNRSFNRRLVSLMHCKLQRLQLLNHVDKALISQVKLDFMERVSPVEKKVYGVSP